MMKLLLNLIALFAGASATNITKHNGAKDDKPVLYHDLNKVMHNKPLPRQLNDGEDGADEVYDYLVKYKLKMRSCIAGEAFLDPDTGEYEYNAVLFRLCPVDGDCDDESANGCDEGYGDYFVGLNSFVKAYMEDKNIENEQYECREYENDNNDQYWIGPACTEDGTNIEWRIDYDEGCKHVPEEITTLLEDNISKNTSSMPYGEGGLVSNSCHSCTKYDNDGNIIEVKEFCKHLYKPALKCETKMEYYSFYGKQEESCEYISDILPSLLESSGSIEKMVVGWWLPFVAAITVIADVLFGGRRRRQLG